MKKDAGMAYVAFCVTLTCTAATAFTFNSDLPHTANLHAPQAIVIPFKGEGLNSRPHLFASRFKFGRNSNKLANGGLLV